MSNRNLLEDIGAQGEYVRDLRVNKPHKKQQIAKAVADFRRMKADAVKTRPELGKLLQRDLYKLSGVKQMNNLRKQSILTKLAARKILTQEMLRIVNAEANPSLRAAKKKFFEGGGQVSKAPSTRGTPRALGSEVRSAGPAIDPRQYERGRKLLHRQPVRRGPEPAPTEVFATRGRGLWR